MTKKTLFLTLSQYAKVIVESDDVRVPQSFVYANFLLDVLEFGHDIVFD